MEGDITCTEGKEGGDGWNGFDFGRKNDGRVAQTTTGNYYLMGTDRVALGETDEITSFLRRDGDYPSGALDADSSPLQGREQGSDYFAGIL